MSGRATKIEAGFKAVFGTPDGRRVLAEILQHCGHGKEIWAKDQLSQNANVTKHDVGTWILNKTKQRSEGA